MYVSRLVLNPWNPGARLDVEQPYEMHRTLMRIVDGAHPENRLLFRKEREERLGGPVYFVQNSRTEPDWSPLLENGYLLRAAETKITTLIFQENQRLAFRLTANPTVKKKVEGKKHSVRVPLVHPGTNRAGHASYLDWLVRQGASHGFRILDGWAESFRTAPRHSPGRRYDKHEIPHFGVRFEGVLEVEDPERMLEAKERGIGPAKAFGFGLITVSRLSGIV